MSNKDAPAFPWDGKGVEGLTKLEYAAIQIAAGMVPMADRDQRAEEQIAHWAVSYADALLDAINEEETP